MVAISAHQYVQWQGSAEVGERHILHANLLKPLFICEKFIVSRFSI